MQTNNALDWLKKTIADFPAMGVALYIRSGTGYSGPNVGDANSALSPEARELSRAFGALLKGRFAGAVSAPGNTSVETARCILDGAGVSASELQVDPDIGDPSLYVTNFELAMSENRNLPVADARQALLTGILRERAAWAIKDPKSAARKIQAKLVALIQPGRVTVFVAPSVAIVATVGFALGKESIGHEDCPIFLEGAVIFRGEKDAVWVRMGSHSGPSVL